MWLHGRSSYFKTLGIICTFFGVICGVIISLVFIGTFGIKSYPKIQVIFIDYLSPAIATASPKFLSFALDSSVIYNKFTTFDTRNVRLQKMMRGLRPAYFRIGGTMADRLHFSDKIIHNRSIGDVMLDGGECAYQTSCVYREKANFTLNGDDWLKLYEIASTSGLDIIFDLNSLIRFPNGTWNSHNAEKMIQFSNEHDLNVNWELGNEPNAFRHQFNYNVSATQLGLDVKTLRNLLKKYPKSRKSLVVGPDTTRPQGNHKESEQYLSEFLATVDNAIDAITWHQYYLNGRTATQKDFLNPKLFDVLIDQINTVKKIAANANKPIWLGETSSAYGGGAPGLSDAFIGSFIWMDKLGLASRMNLSVVIRQSITNGDYSLLNRDYYPNPDYWVSLLYKRLMGSNAVQCYSATSANVRLYCNCAKDGSVIVFGLNLDKELQKIRIERTADSENEVIIDLDVLQYELTSCKSILTSKTVCLNGRILELSENDELPELVPKKVATKPFLTMKPFSIVFWIIPGSKAGACDI